MSEPSIPSTLKSSEGLPSLAEGSQDGPEPRSSSQTSSQQERKERRDSEEEYDRLNAAETRFKLDYTQGRFTDEYETRIKPGDLDAIGLQASRLQLAEASQAIELTYVGLEPRDRVCANGIENRYTRSA